MRALREAIARLRESDALGPPNYRPAEGGADCSTCFYDVDAACRRYGFVSVDASHVCDTYEARLREGEFKAGKHRVYFQNADTLRDAADLYAVLKEQADTGSPNLENEQAKGMVETLQQGKLLNGDQLNRLLELLKRHAADLADYRKSDDPSRDILAVPKKSPDSARILS